MGWLARAAIIVCTATLFSALTNTGASAQFCASNAECGDIQVCDKWLFGTAGTCSLTFCNTQADCGVTRRPSLCVLGVCQAICRSNVNCPGQVCAPVPGSGVGICTAAPPAPPAPPPPAPGSGSGSGAGIGQAGEGQACGPRRFGGGVIKSVGCKPGLLCQNARCVRLPQ